MNVPANAAIDINYSKISTELGAIFEEHRETIQSLTRSRSITERSFSKDEGMVQVIFNDGLIYLSLKGIIDFEQEKNRLQKSLLKIEKEMNKIEIKLKSENLEDFKKNLPDLIVIDGGRNQMNVASAVLKKYKLEIPILAIAKGEKRNEGREDFYFRDRIFSFPTSSSVLSVSYTHLTLPANREV